MMTGLQPPLTKSLEVESPMSWRAERSAGAGAGAAMTLAVKRRALRRKFILMKVDLLAAVEILGMEKMRCS
jgi:hypothetical protein